MAPSRTGTAGQHADAVGMHTREQQLAESLRRAARRFATGVTVVAVSYGQSAHALTANSFVTLSLTPALIGVAVRRQGRMRQLVEQVRSFGVSVLNGGQEDFARHYANHDRNGPPTHLTLPLSDTSPMVPIVPGCVAYFACRLQDIYPVGDHDLVVGLVAECDAADVDRAPLIFLDGRLRGFGA